MSLDWIDMQYAVGQARQRGVRESKRQGNNDCQEGKGASLFFSKVNAKGKGIPFEELYGHKQARVGVTPVQ